MVLDCGNDAQDVTMVCKNVQLAWPRWETCKFESTKLTKDKNGIWQPLPVLPSTGTIALLLGMVNSNLHRLAYSRLLIIFYSLPINNPKTKSGSPPATDRYFPVPYAKFIGKKGKIDALMLWWNVHTSSNLFENDLGSWFANIPLQENKVIWANKSVSCAKFGNMEKQMKNTKAHQKCCNWTANCLSQNPNNQSAKSSEIFNSTGYHLIKHNHTNMSQQWSIACCFSKYRWC